jgi:hypothetical protein
MDRAPESVMSLIPRGNVQIAARMVQIDDQGFVTAFMELA